MRFLRSIVAPSAAFLAFCDPKMTGCSSIRSQLICDELVWDKAIFLQKPLHEFQRGALVPFRLDQHIEDLALGVDGSPQIDRAGIDTLTNKWAGVCDNSSGHEAHFLCPPPISARGHPARCLALPPVHLELPGCRGSPG